MKKLFLSFVMLLATAVSALAVHRDVILEIAPKGSNTFFCPFDFTLPEGVRAFVVTGYDNDEKMYVMEEVSEVEANTPYYVLNDTEEPIEQTFEGDVPMPQGIHTAGILTVYDAVPTSCSGWILDYNDDDEWGFIYVENYELPVYKGIFSEGPTEFSPDPAPTPTPEEHAHLVLSNNVGTFICPFAAEIPNGMAAFKIMGIEENEFVMVPEESGSFQPNTAYMIGGEGNYDLDIPGVKTEHEASYTTGLLTGYYENTQITSGYMVQMGDDRLVYVQATQENPLTVPANQCVLSQIPLQPHAVSYVTVGEGGLAFGVEEGTPGESMAALVYVNDGYQVVSVTVNDGNVPVELQPVGGGYKATYTMPDEDVTVKVTFAIVAEPAKWTDSEGNEVTELMANAPYFSYVAEYPTITLHLEGAVYGEDGQPLADGSYEFDHSVDGVVYPSGYEVSDGQVNMNVNFHLIPNGEVQATEPYTLFAGTPIPTINYLYTQYARDNEERTPLWEETQWSFVGFPENMQLGEDTDPEAGEEFVLGNLGEFGGGYQALQVNADKLTDGAGVMIAKQITFENRSAGKMTVTFSRPNNGADLFLNVDGEKWAQRYQSEVHEHEFLGNIEGDSYEHGSANTDEVEVTFYVNPGMHIIRGHYSSLWADDPAADPEDEEAVVSVEGSDGELYEMSAAEYHSAQDIRIYRMRFEPIVHEVTVNSQYGWASIYHEHDLIVPEMETETETETDVTFYYASSCDGNNVTLAVFTPMTQCNPYTEGKVIPANTALVFKDNNGGGTYIFYGATVGDPEELWKAGKWIAGPWDRQPEYEPTLDPENNLFLGVIEDKPCDPMQYYVLGNETTPETAIFQKYSGTTLGAHKVYLDLDGAAASVRLVLPGTNPLPTDVQQNAADVKANKFLMDGQLFIRKGTRTYNVQGMILR